MTLNAKTLHLLIALTLSFLASPSLAQTKEGDPQKPDDLQRQLSEVKTRLDALAAVVQELEKLRGDTARSFQAAQKQLDALQEQLARAQKDLQTPREPNPPSTRASGYGPAASEIGRIRLLNTYVSPVTVVVNGKPYRLAPGDTELLDGQSPGMFTYEVQGIQRPVNRVLAANETFTINVYPR